MNLDLDPSVLKSKRIAPRNVCVWAKCKLPDLAFQVSLNVGLKNASLYKARAVSCQPEGETLSNGCDGNDVVLYFKPHLTKQQCAKSILKVAYTGEKTCQPLQLAIPLFPSNLECVQQTFAEYVFDVYPTHSICYAGPDVVSVVFGLCNTQTTLHGQKEILLSWKVDNHALFFEPLFGTRYEALPWFPPHLDPAEYDVAIDPQNIPQGTPLWFKSRGPVTGSKAYKLMGFFVPTKKKNPTWRFYDRETFDAASRVRMRKGSVYEDLALAFYLHHFKKRIVSQVGWCSNASNSPLPASWGASPDGLIYDPDAAWDNMLESTSKEYTHKSEYDIHRGVLEIKCTKRGPQGYHIVQMYMEMMATNRVWGDLVCMDRKRALNPDTGAWQTYHDCFVYRIYRHPPTERILLRCLKRAYENVNRLQDIVHGEPEFKKMRLYFEQVASQVQGVKLDCSQHLVDAFASKANAIGQMQEDDEAADDVWSMMHQHINQMQRAQSQGDGVSLTNIAMQLQKDVASLVLLFQK